MRISILLISALLAQAPAQPPLPAPQAPAVEHGRGLHLQPGMDARVRAVNARPGNAEARQRRLAVQSVPASYIVPKLPPVKDQGSYGCCWGFATIGVLESLYLAQGQVISASEQYVIDHNKDGFGCDGGDVAFDFLLSTGTATEAACPYRGCAANDSATPVYKLASWAFIGDDSTAPSDTAMKQQILTSGPLCVGVAAGAQWDSYAGGRSVITGGLFVNHEVVIVGWDDTISAWLVRNSWGTAWATATLADGTKYPGYCWVRYGSGQIGVGAAFAAVTPAPAPAPVATSIRVTPATATLAPGSTQQFASAVLDQSGNPMSGWTATWTASAGTIAQTGLYTAPAIAGTATITATVAPLAGTATVTIAAPSPTPTPTPLTIITVTPAYANGFGFIQVQLASGSAIFMIPANQPAKAK